MMVNKTIKKKTTRKKPTKKPVRKRQIKKKTVLKEEEGRGIWVICHKCHNECKTGEWECDGGPYICLKCLGRKRNTLYINVEGEGE